MALKLISPPALLPVSLADAKLQARIDGEEEDSLITGMIRAATEQAEQMLNRALMPQVWELTLDQFPQSFELTRVPVIGIASITYANKDGVQTAMTGAEFAMDNADDYGFCYVLPAYGTVWPQTRDEINAVRLRYVAGYPNASAVPELIKTWIKLKVASMYQNRDNEVLGFLQAQMSRYRVYAF